MLQQRQQGRHAQLQCSGGAAGGGQAVRSWLCTTQVLPLLPVALISFS